MKIFILITKASIGGAQMSVINLARELAIEGHRVVVGSGQGSFLYNELIASDIPFVKFSTLKRSHNPLDVKKFEKEFKEYLDSNEFDVVHINSSNALPGAKAAKKSKYKPKTVFTFRGLSLIDKNYNKNKLLKSAYIKFFKHYLNFVDEAVFVSQDNYKTAIEKDYINKGTVIYNGLNQDIKFHSPARAKKVLAAHLQTDLDDKFIIGSIGRLCYAKNYDFLLNIFPKILNIEPQAISIIIGPGELTTKQKAIIKKNNLKNKVFFTGGINNANRYLKLFDLLALTSIYEGMPITLIEGLIAGMPILSSKVGGVSEMMNNDERQLFEMNNQNDFLNKFVDLSQNRKIISEVKKQNKQRALEFDIRKTVEGYIKMYKK